MPTCKKCNSNFKNSMIIDGKRRSLQRRKFCLECSPFKLHNTKDLSKNIVCHCIKCKETNPEQFYFKKSGNPYSYCKSCTNKQTVVRQKQKKEYAVNLKGGKCENCGYSKSMSALEFHHIDPSKKDSSIRFSSNSKESINMELSLCVLLCSNCHREEHDKINIDKK